MRFLLWWSRGKQNPGSRLISLTPRPAFAAAGRPAAATFIVVAGSILYGLAKGEYRHDCPRRFLFSRNPVQAAPQSRTDRNDGVLAGLWRSRPGSRHQGVA